MRLSVDEAAQRTLQERYDRQLRLWGERGQRQLQRARLLVVGASAVGAELLKSVVLSGIGHCTVADAARVRPEDVGSNFLVSEADVGLWRAEVVCEALREMNTAVSVEAMVGEPAQLLERVGAASIATYSLVAVARQPRPLVQQLADLCWEHDVPLVVVQSHGLVGYVTMVVREHIVMDVAGGGSAVPLASLQLARPFTEVVEFCRDRYWPLERLDDDAHAHVPWLALLVLAMEDEPQPSVESVVHRLERWRRHEGEPNFTEALRMAKRVLRGASDPPMLLTLERCRSRAVEAVARALRTLQAKRGLPVSRAIPEMHCDTASFVGLQEVYRRRAAEDVAALREVLAADAEAAAGGVCVDDQLLRVICDNLYNMACIRTGPYRPETGCGAGKRRADDFEGEDGAASWLVLMHAYDAVREKHRAPLEDATVLEAALQRVLQQFDLVKVHIRPARIQETLRAAAVELHPVAAVVGAIGAQEALKVLTQCFVPVDGTVVYDGYACRATVLSNPPE